MAAEEISLEDLQTDEDIQPVVKSHISKGALTQKKCFSLSVVNRKIKRKFFFFFKPKKKN